MHNTPHIIALTGLAGAGKDTAADVLATHCGFTTLAFAGALRYEIQAAYNLIDASTLTDRTQKEEPTSRLAFSECADNAFIGAVAIATAATVSQAWMHAPRSPRQIMQWWGTEYRRARQPNYWSTKLAIHIADLQQLDGRHRFVVSDCRFDNEAAAIRRMGGQVWQITRPGLERADSAHISETTGDALQPERTITNGADLHTLRERVLGAWWATEAHLKAVQVVVTE